MKEFDLYPPMQHWLELYLKDKYKSADEIIVWLMRTAND